MTEEKKDVEETTTEEETSSESSTEEKTEDKKEDKKVLKTGEDNLSTDKQEEWDNQPASATQEGTEEVEEEKDKQVAGLEKERERIDNRKAEILAEIKVARGEVKELESEKQEIAKKVEPVEDDGWEKVNDRIDDQVADAVAKTEFYATKPDFYSGEEGIKNQALVEQYVNAHFKKSTNQARTMAHNHIFGEFEKDSAVRKAKTETKSKMLASDVASIGSTTGGTVPSGKKAKRSILPKSQPVDKWYE